MWGPRNDRCAVTLSFDFDAETLWTGTFNLHTPTPISRGRFGARAGLPRALELLDTHGIKATVFVPGRVAELYPGLVKEIADAGHEIGYHGYAHESVLEVTEEEERRIMTRGIEALRKVTGETPRGNRSPPFALGPHTAKLLEEFGFVYDSSLMGHDGPYVPEHDGRRFNIVELPVSWELDDAPYFLFNYFPYYNGLTKPGDVYEIWKEEFECLYRRGGCFLLVLHPQVIGRWPHIEMVDRLIRHITSHEAVWFATHIEVALDWQNRNGSE